MSLEKVSTERLENHTYEVILDQVHPTDMQGLNYENRLEPQKGIVDMSLIKELEQANQL